MVSGPSCCWFRGAGWLGHGVPFVAAETRRAWLFVSTSQWMKVAAHLQPQGDGQVECEGNPILSDGSVIASRLLAAEDVEHVPEQAAPLSALRVISGPGPCLLLTASELVVPVGPALAIVVAVPGTAVISGASRLHGGTPVITVGTTVRTDLRVDNSIQLGPVEKDTPAFGALVDEHAAPLVGAHRATALEAGQGRVELGLGHQIPSMERVDSTELPAREDRRPTSFWISTTQNRAVDATRTTARSGRLSASVERSRWAGGQ